MNTKDEYRSPRMTIACIAGGVVYMPMRQLVAFLCAEKFVCSFTVTMIRNFACLFAVFSQLHHPNIVHFYGAGVPPNLFYVMELCQRSLFDLLHHCRRSICTHERVKMAVRGQEAMLYEVSLTGRGMRNTNNIIGNIMDVMIRHAHSCSFQPILANSAIAGSQHIVE